MVAGTLEQRLGAAESLEFLETPSNDPLADALISDPAPRVRAAALSSLSKKSPGAVTHWLLAGLVDRDPAVREVALEAAAPLLEKGSDELKKRLGFRLREGVLDRRSPTSRSAPSTPPPRGARRAASSSPRTRTTPTP